MTDYYLQCINCSKRFDSSGIEYTCPDCGDLLGTLDVIFDYSGISAGLSKEELKENSTDTIFRYLPLLPINPNSVIYNLKIGRTPLYSYPSKLNNFGISQLYLKDESFNPSLSLKDRASAISLLKAREAGFKTVATASTGNAAASMACIGAHLGLKTVIFVPESIPRAKLIQLQIFGAHIILVKGNYDVAFDLCRDVSEKKNWYNRSTAINPFNLEGKKTAAFEICEQLDFDIPDYVFIPVGDGCIISGIWKGFTDFYKIGLIERLPRLVACQAKGSAAIHNAFKNKWIEPRPVIANTIADSISVNLPRDGVKALRALRDSNGDSILIADDEILYSQQKLAEDFGIFCEPSAAAAFAGLVKYKQVDRFKVSDSALALLTGNGLKDLASAEKTVVSKKKIILDPVKDDLEDKFSLL